MSETQKQRIKRRITERAPTEIMNRECYPKSRHPYTKVLTQTPMNYKNRATRRQLGMHKGLPDLFNIRTLQHASNCQKRVYIGFFKHNQLVKAQAVPAQQFKYIKSGVIITRKQYLHFINKHSEPTANAAGEIAA